MNFKKILSVFLLLTISLCLLSSCTTEKSSETDFVFVEKGTDNEKSSYDPATSVEAQKETGISKDPESEKDTYQLSDSMVWVPTKGGTKYHRSSDCSNMDGPRHITKSQAISEGFTPCKRCYK